MKNYLKDSNLYLVIAFVIMAILFFSSSQTYEQQSQVGLLDKLLSSHPFEEQLKNISFLSTLLTVIVGEMAGQSSASILGRDGRISTT